MESSNSLSSDLLLFDSSPEWATALSLKNRMRWEGLHPDVITWNTLLSATGRWESILRALVMVLQGFSGQFVLHLGKQNHYDRDCRTPKNK